MLCPRKLPYHAYRIFKIVSAGRYIDVSHTEHSIHLQMKTTCYMREVSINLLTVTETLSLGHSQTEKCVHIMVRLKCRILNIDVNDIIQLLTSMS